MPYYNTQTVIRFFALISALFLLSGNLYAHDHGHRKKQKSDSNIRVKHARVNPIFAGMPVTVAYFSVYNNSDKDLSLVAVSGSISERIEIHKHIMADGLMKMQEVANGAVLPAGKMAEFKPGGDHIMIMDMNQDIKEGDKVELNLTFSDGSTQMITAIAKKPSMDHSPHKDHHQKHRDKMEEHKAHKKY